MSDQTKSLNMLVYVNIKESCRGRIKLHKLSWSRYRFSTFVSLVHKTLYLTGQGYSLLGNLARLSTSVSTRKSLVSGQLSTNPLIKVSIHRPLLNVSFRTHFNGEILRHFSTTLDNRAKLMLVIPTKLSLCTRSMKKVTEKVAKEVAKASSEESSNLVPKVAPSAGLHSPNTSLGSGQPKLPLSKSDGDLPKAKSCGGAFLDRSFGLGSRTSGNNPLTPLGGNTQTTTQVTSANNHDMGKEVDTRDYVPGKGYSGYDHTKRVIGVKPDGKPILESEVRTSTGQQTPLHETNNTIVVDDATDLGVGILTSSKNPQFIPISNNNYKNQTVGASNQNPLKPKGQQIGFFDQPRSYEDNTLKKNYDASEFLTDKGPLLDELLSKAPVGSAFNIPQKRIHKDSSSLYHENGQPIYDTNGNE